MSHTSQMESLQVTLYEKLQKLTLLFMHACMRPACLGMTFKYISFWDGGCSAKNPRCPQFLNPKYSGDGSTSICTIKSESVLQTPPFAHQLEDSMNKLGTSTNKFKAENTSLAKLLAENTKHKD